MADEIDSLIASLDEQAFGSMYNSNQQHVTPQFTVKSQTKTQRGDSLADLLQDIDLDLAAESTSPKSQSTQRVSQLMNMPVAIGDSNWNSSAPSSSRTAETSNYTSSRSPSVYNSNVSRNTSSYSPASHASRTNEQIPRGSGYIQTASVGTANFSEDPYFQHAELDLLAQSAVPVSTGSTYGRENLRHGNPTLAKSTGSTYGRGNSNYTTPAAVQSTHIAPNPSSVDNPDLKAHSRLCYRCNQVIGADKRILAQGQLYHLHCWVCKICSKHLLNEKYYIKDEQPYCEDCVGNVQSELCKKCNQSILGPLIEAMGGSWHPSCFVCNRCSKSFGEKGFFLRGTTALCDSCIKSPQSLDSGASRTQGGAICIACRGAIVGEASFSALGSSYHRRCFKCAVCQTELWNQSFFSSPEGKVLCPAHGR